MFTPFAYRATKATAAAGPSIITTGLIRYYNAGDASSYPGSGTTWTDLQGSGFNLTLNNTPAFTSDGAGSYFTFDGSNEDARGSDSGLPNGNNARTIFMWTYRLDPSDFKSMYFYGTQNFNRQIGVYQQAGGSPFNRAYLVDGYGCGFGTGGQFEFPMDVYSFLGFHMDSSGFEYTLNGVSVGSGALPCTVDTLLGGATSLRLANVPDIGFGNLRIAQFLFYNTKLTAADALTNYNATKASYGL